MRIIPLVNTRVAVTATLVLALLQSIPVSAAQRSAEERETARAVPTDTAIRVDGRLDEPAWKAAPAIAQFLQKDPQEGQAATERTEIRILYTRRAVSTLPFDVTTRSRHRFWLPSFDATMNSSATTPSPSSWTRFMTIEAAISSARTPKLIVVPSLQAA
jgi:hypothetical protein